MDVGKSLNKKHVQLREPFCAHSCHSPLLMREPRITTFSLRHFHVCSASSTFQSAGTDLPSPFLAQSAQIVVREWVKNEGSGDGRAERRAERRAEGEVIESVRTTAEEE
jgi:hypothetical protein